MRTPQAGDIVPLGAIALVVQQVTDGRVANVGLRLAEELEPETPPATLLGRLKRAIRRGCCLAVTPERRLVAAAAGSDASRRRRR